ncbi:MAG TPA: NAD-binding protein [Ignavibacteriaceae bacterium]|nr:NAD-binding protein [Ignavibacteriaceae bacterium]
MKFLPSIVTYFIQSRSTVQNIKLLIKFLFVLILMIGAYSVLFHYIMEWENREFSWLTGLYWTLTVMTTLGFGDITFVSDFGRFFSIIVLLSGVLFLLVLLPFTFIQFFYAPWIEAQAKSRTPRELPIDTKNHVIITNFDPLSAALVEKLKFFNIEYVIVVEDNATALQLYDKDYRVAIGNLDDPETYKKMRVENASMVLAVGSDEVNTNISFTVRELSETIPIVSTIESEASDDILKLAGSNHVFQFHKILGRSLARRTVGGDARSNIIAEINGIIIAEAPVIGTPLGDKKIIDCKLRETTGVSIIGMWERGNFQIVTPETLISRNSVLVLAGTNEMLSLYDELFCIYHPTTSPVIIIGNGRVGSATGKALDEKGIEYLIIEKNPRFKGKNEKVLIGDVADIEILQNAGIYTTGAIIITTKDDATNIYLTIYCRRLRPDVQIISRSTSARNISTLHRAGADIVMSYDSLGANTIFNLLQNDEVTMITEGLDIFKTKVPKSLIGKNLIQSEIRSKTNCNVVALEVDGKYDVNPNPTIPLIENQEMLLIGTVDSEKKFMTTFSVI